MTGRSKDSPPFTVIDFACVLPYFYAIFRFYAAAGRRGYKLQTDVRFMNQFECKVATHGRYELELNITYPVERELPRTRYGVDAFFFTPCRLGLDKDNYGVNRVLRDLRSYVRFTPTPIALARLVNPQCDISPLTRIRRLLANAALAHELDEKSLLYELRALVNIFQAQMRETRGTIEQLVAFPRSVAEVNAFGGAFLAELPEFLGQFRKLHTDFLDSRVSSLLRQGLEWADEAISLNTEKTLYRLHAVCRSRADLAGILAQLESELGREQQYRQQQKYMTVIVPGQPESGEIFLYRESMLKKWAQSAMYIEAKPHGLAARIAQIFAGLAAAAAMAFAVVAAFLAGKWFALYSLPWALLIVVSYIFKDRIKEMLRNFFITALPRLVADEKHILLDPKGLRRAGAVKFRVRFCRPDQMSATVTRLRNLKVNPFRDLLLPENILHLQIDMDLVCRQLARHIRLEALSHILRLTMNSWLTHMDDPHSPIEYMQNGARRQMQADRVYHVNLILRLSSGKKTQPSRYFQYRIILNRDGILRIEPLAVSLN